MRIHTVGHSTRTVEEFVAVLAAHGVTEVADVRTMPRSRHTPQFNAEDLGPSLASHGIGYRHVAKLGGLRHTRRSSPNTGWRNASFRGYADHMQTEEFGEGLEELLEVARGASTAIMCAEAVPWRCHRSLIADALLVRDIEVLDVFDAAKARPERLTSFARVDGTRILYPDPDELELPGD